MESDKTEKRLKNALILFSFILIVWSLYRLLFHFPSLVEELFLKPLLWIGPMIFLMRRERSGLSSVGIGGENLVRVMYLVFAMGAFWVFEALGLNYFRHGGFNFGGEIGGDFGQVFGISLVTAMTEEIVFRGYIFSRIWDGISNEWVANIITSVGWTVLHFPVALFGWNLNLESFGLSMLLVFMFSFGSGFIYGRTRNVIPSVALHVLWEWPIILFR